MASAQKLQPNKSTLFGAIIDNPTYQASSSTPNITAAATKGSSKSSSVAPIILVGGDCGGNISPKLSPKPSVPAKPRGLHNLANVSRHNSMNIPRSPTSGGRPAYSTPSNFGTMQHHQSRESINSIKRMAPKPPIARPTVAPPKPPTHSASNASLSEILQKTSNCVGAVNQTLVRSSTPNPSSLHSQASAKSNVVERTTIGGPLTSWNHRTMPAPLPPQLQANNGSGPPEPPQRYSFLPGNNVRTTQSFTKNSTTTGGSRLPTLKANALNGLANDMETKFGERFHNVTEFPKPPPFLNIQKVYPSRCG